MEGMGKTFSFTNWKPGFQVVRKWEKIKMTIFR